MGDFGERIKKVREYLGLSQEDFAVLVDSGSTTIGDWEANRHTPRPPTIRKMIDPINNRGRELGLQPISFHWLRTGEGDMFLTTFQQNVLNLSEAGKRAIEGAVPSKPSKIDEMRKQVADVITKSHNHPGINVWANAGMGGGFFDPDERTEPIEIIEAAHLLNHKYQDAFRAWGQSMMPVIRHNALCFCDFNDRATRGEEIYVFNLPSTGLVIKELRIHKEADAAPRYIIYSYNASPEYYSKEEIEAENFIVGRVTLIHQETNK